MFLYFLFTISLTYGFKALLKYETTQNKIKICEKLLKSIRYGYLKVDFKL